MLRRIILFVLLIAMPASAQWVTWPAPPSPAGEWANFPASESVESLFRYTLGVNKLDPDRDPAYPWNLGSAGLEGQFRDVMGSGLLNWTHAGRQLTQQAAGGGGLNFEHIIGLLPSDAPRSSYSPRKDPCTLRVIDERTGALHWDAARSAWPIDVTVTYTAQPDGIDITLAAVVKEELASQQVRFMFASYMERTHLRSLFYGPSPKQQLGTDAQYEEVGRQGWAVAGKHSPPVPLLPDAAELNLRRLPAAAWNTPCWFGYVDGDANLNTDDVYVMSFFFEQQNVEMLMWSWQQPAISQQFPAWDWCFVLYGPKVGPTYTWRAHVGMWPALRDGGDRLDHVGNWERTTKEYAVWKKRLAPVEAGHPPVLRFRDATATNDALPEVEYASLKQGQEWRPLEWVNYGVSHQHGPLFVNGASVAGKLSVGGTVDPSTRGDYVAVFTLEDPDGRATTRELPVRVE